MKHKSLSHNPGLFFYCVLLGFSVNYFLFVSPSTQALGVFVFLWSVLVISRVLMLGKMEDVLKVLRFGRRRKRKITRRRRSSGFTVHHDPLEETTILPQKILSDLEKRKTRKVVSNAVKAIDVLAIIWLALALCYWVYGALTSFNAVMPDEIISIQNMIRDFLMIDNIKGDPFAAYKAHHLIMNMSLLWMLGAAFWLGQSYAYGNYYASALLWVAAALFCVSTIFAFLPGGGFEPFGGEVENVAIDARNLSHGYGWGSLPLIDAMGLNHTSEITPFYKRTVELGFTAVVLLYISFVLIGLVFARGFFRRSIQNKISAGLGFSVLVVLLFFDICMPYSTKLMALWLSGMAVLSTLWALSQSRGHRVYRIYQKG